VHERYARELRGLGWLTLPPDPTAGVESSYYFYWVQVDPEIRDRLAAHLRDHEVYSTFRYFPLHLVAHYGHAERLPNAETAAETTLCIPLHQSLSDDDVTQVVDAIASFR
jgi:dTDP-4-amino-4,6-dideoxygalactose transaminase